MIKRNQWKRYVAKGIAAAAAAMIAAANYTDAHLTARAETVQSGEEVSSSSNAEPATGSNAGAAVTNLMGARTEQKCGDNLTWAYDAAAKTLTISGSGEMWDFGEDVESAAPWQSFASEIEKVVIGEQVETIGARAFRSCGKLTTVKVMSMTPPTLEEKVFEGTDFLEDGKSVCILLPDGAHEAYWRAEDWEIVRRYIKTGSFGYCGKEVAWDYDTATKKLTISGTGAMKDYAGATPAPWSGWGDEITAVVIEGGVTAIGESAFSTCENLKSAAFSPGTATNVTLKIGTGAFETCRELKSVTFDEKYQEIMIGESAFSECKALEELSIGVKVTEINESAFYECICLETVIFKKSVGTIGKSAFEKCNTLKTLTFQGDVGSIGDNAFSEAVCLKSATFEGNVTSIGMNAFVKCNKLESVIFEGEVETIGDQAFQGCEKVKTMTFKKGVKHIGASTFMRCSSLTDASFAKKVETIGKEAFSGCSFTNLFFEQNVKIGEQAFFECEALESLTFGGNVEEIGFAAFFETPKLKKVIFEGNIANIDVDAFDLYGEMRTFVFRGDRKILRKEMIDECGNVTGLEFEGKIGTIEADAFTGCTQLTTVTFQDDIEQIGDRAFCGCVQLSKICFGTDVPKIGADVFLNTLFAMDQEKGIVVPNEQVRAYRSQWPEWADYITGLLPEDTPAVGTDDDDDKDSGTVVTAKTAALPSYAVKGTWTKSENGNWRFIDEAGTVYRNRWVYAFNPYADGGKRSYDWFYFNENGVMLTGWFTDPADGNIYYLNPESDGRRGAMAVGLKYLDIDGDGKTESYYFNEKSDGTKGKLMDSSVAEKTTV